MSIDTKLSMMIVPLVECALPLLCFLIACCLPGYIGIAFNDPFGLWLLGAMFLWNCIGLVLNFVFKATFVRVIVGLVFGLPLSVFVFYMPMAVNALHSTAK